MSARRTGARRSAAKEATWRKLLAEWRSSGKTLGEFAAERGVKYWTARGWATELKKRHSERAKEPVVPEGPHEAIAAPEPVFAPVRVASGCIEAARARPAGPSEGWSGRKRAQTPGRGGAAPLPSWNDGASKKAVVTFVERVTKAGSPVFVAPAERIAVFDNDGTLWSEQPMYVQLAFALDLVVATHAGTTSDEFAAIAAAWLEKARHPRFARPYTETVYQPMLELLASLRASGFKTYIVSGGGVEMVRSFSE